MSPAEEMDGARLARWRSLVGLASRFLTARGGVGRSSRGVLAISIVALAVASLVLVTSISVGIASQSTVYGDDVDYWITPRSTDTLSTVLTQEGAQLGDVHSRTAQVQRIDGVQAASPVLLEIVRMRGVHSTRPEYVLAVGVIPPRDGLRVVGLSTTSLSPGDPYYANGTYDGRFTGEVVLSRGAAALLNASAGDGLAIGSPISGEVEYSFATRSTGSASISSVRGDVPVALMHLSELQALTGARTGDQADQFLVRTSEPGVKSELSQVFPDATVTARRGATTTQLVDAELPLAVSVAALLISLVVAVLSIATTMGLEIEHQRRTLAIFEAVGIARYGRLLFVTGLTVGIAMVGGLIGVGLGTLSALAMNAIDPQGVETIAAVRPMLVGYGLIVALIAGVLAVPYPLLIALRTTPLEELK